MSFWKTIPGFTTELRQFEAAAVLCGSQRITFAECGVLYGRSFFGALQAFENLKLTIERAYACDPWGETAQAITERKFPDRLSIDPENYFKQALKMSPWFDHVSIFKDTGLWSTHSNIFLPLNIVHIDGAHDTNSVLKDLMLWSPRLAPNGVLVLDDFAEHFEGVVTGVFRWLVEESISPQRSLIVGRSLVIQP